jgi:hypothetical protein
VRFGVEPDDTSARLVPIYDGIAKARAVAAVGKTVTGRPRHVARLRHLDRVPDPRPLLRFPDPPPPRPASVTMALPLAVLATNVTPSRALYYASRATIGFTRAVPDLLWALPFVTPLGLRRTGDGGALDPHAGPGVRRDDRERGHGADRRAVTDRGQPAAGVHPPRGAHCAAAMNLFQYREVSLLLIVIFVIVCAAERLI